MKDVNSMKMIDKILDKDEKVFWEGKPKFWPFFIGSFFISMFGLLFLVSGSLILISGLRGGNILVILFPYFWIGLAMTFGPPLYSYLVYKNIYYAITNKRVIFQKGLIGIDFEIVDFDKITNAEVNVNILAQLFGGGSGSILISTAGTWVYGRGIPINRPYTISHIENPYEVFKFFKKISHDVKTDIEFPNK